MLSMCQCCQTEAIARLANVLKRDMRDIDIIMTEDTNMIGQIIDIDHNMTFVLGCSLFFLYQISFDILALCCKYT